ncbi:MAG TPA: hypothetical protein VMX17_01795 [Candidatus Glassbacteria bacterium]|jgi:hypothetical protein|nr:hypothetical protein [Candidatus Glassbacteria bacterium]
MKKDTYGWLFVDKTPLLCKKKNVDRQQKIETWLNLYQLTKALGINKSKLKKKIKTSINYII